MGFEICISKRSSILTLVTKASGNYGIGDMITALRWVQLYISAFGGNNDNYEVKRQLE